MEVIGFIISIVFRGFNIDTVSIIVTIVLTLMLYSKIMNKKIIISKKYVIAIVIMSIITQIFGIINFINNIEQYNEDIDRETWAHFEYGTDVPGSQEAHLYEYMDTQAIPIIAAAVMTYKDLCKAEGDKRFSKSTDWFYDTK